MRRCYYGVHYIWAYGGTICLRRRSESQGFYALTESRDVSPFHLFRDNLILFVLRGLLLVGIVCFCCVFVTGLSLYHLVRCITVSSYPCHNCHDARSNGAKKKLCFQKAPSFCELRFDLLPSVIKERFLSE